MGVTTGVGLFIHMTDQSPLFKNRQNDLVRNFIKGTLRYAVAAFALGFFSKMSIYFNILSCMGKAFLGASYRKRKFKFLKNEYTKEAKLHLVGAIVDLAVIALTLPVIILYAISPEHILLLKDQLEKKLINQNATK